MPYGHEDLANAGDVRLALRDVARQRPAARRAVVKQNESFSGEGNAIVDLKDDDPLRTARFAVPSETYDSYLAKFVEGGGIVEELIEAEETTSPSAQLRINPRRDVILPSTHEQLLGGDAKQLFLGCTFPARDDYRIAVQDAGLRVGEALASKGIIGRFSVDFLASRSRGDAWRLTALEINLRMGGTTHPTLALRFLTGGELDRATGLFRDLDGRAKFYRASDNVCGAQYRGLLPEDLIEILTMHHLDWSHRTGTGVLFHMFGAISQYGKVGMIAIGNSAAEADALYAKTVDVLDRECGVHHTSA